MTDSMKFGPEWLRNLSGDSCNSGGSGGGTANLITPRYQLAEHRYGREEMLALFDRNCKPPETLVTLQTLYVEKTQLPLAFIPETEDETRVRNSGVSNTGGRGRGGSVDRGGRARSGRGGMYSSHFSRGVGFDDLGDGSRLDSQPYSGRNRAFDRSQSERSWSERNGITDTGDWNGSTSPRKEPSRGLSSTSLLEANWRRHRGAGDDEEGWRVIPNNRGEKWVRGNWRDGGGSDRDRLDRIDGEGDENRGGRWEIRPSHRSSHDSSHHHHPARTSRTWESNHHENHDNLPEWATENPSESGGSFDATGAFHGDMFSDDDEDGVLTTSGTHENRTRRISDGTNNTNPKSGHKSMSCSNNNMNQPNRQINLTANAVSRERPKSLHPFNDKEHTSIEQERRSNSPTKQSVALSTNPLMKMSTQLNNPTMKTDSNTEDPVKIVESNRIQGPQRSKSFVELPSKRNIDNSQPQHNADNLTTLSFASRVAHATNSDSQPQHDKVSCGSTNVPPQDTLAAHAFALRVAHAANSDSQPRSDCDMNAISVKYSMLHPLTPKVQNINDTLINDSQSQHDPAVLTARNKSQSLHQKLQDIVSNTKTSNVMHKPDDDLDRMKEEADMLVAKLMADEESHREEVPPVMISVTNRGQPQMTTAPTQEKWFYRDPQGEVQGPFLASEMAEWCKAGYFTQGLLVRRTCDERYATLGDLTKLCGRVPFIPGPPIPPLKLTEPAIPTVPNAVPANLSGSALPKPGIEDPMILFQYQQLRMLHHQQLLLRQMKSSAIAKLSQSEHWATLSPVEQNQLIMQCVMQDSEMRDIPLATNPFVAPLTQNIQAAANPVMQLFNQIQQAKTQSDNHLPTAPHPSTGQVHPSATGLDPIQQLIQQMGGVQNLSGPPQPTLNPTQPQPPQEDDAIKSLLRQLHVNANGHPPQAHQIDSIWPHPPPQINPSFNAQNWLTQVGPLPPMPPGQIPNSLWDLHTKEMKTEQQILEEQNIRIQEDRKKDEFRKKEELKRQAEGQNAKRKCEEEVARQFQEANRKEEEKKRREEEKKLKEEEKRKQEEELKKKEEKKRRDEEKKREEKRKQDEENNRKKQEEEKKKREEAKKLEEKSKKEEEKRKKLEDEQKRIEEERLKKEEETRRKAESEEQARKMEQRRREAEALKKLQERSKAPWAQTSHAPPPTTHASLADIQRLEREKKAEEQRYQQMMQQQLVQQKAMEAAKEIALVESSKRLQFKWAEKAAPTNKQPQVKSLAQIQQEEQERIAKVKQQEKERQEKANKNEVAAALQNAGIWGTASQSLNWACTTNSGNDIAKTSSKAWTGTGFWDEPVVTKPTVTSKPLVKVASASIKSTTSSQQQQQQQQINNSKTLKNKAKKEEELVKKLFDNSAKPDDFTQWCSRTLSGLQASVDIPTFVGFLRDIESAYEVKEYVRMYLGDSKQCTEFAKQFLEKRSKWRSAQRPQAEADDLCKPAPAVNPNAPTEFQEVKGKSKKPKKGKMFKVDNRILGFSVTAATDRINVGDRDYGEGV